MGPRRARAAAPTLLDRPGVALVVMGFGGGLDEQSDVGDVVVADAVQGPDGVAVACAGGQTLAEALERRGLRVRRGTVASVARLAMGDARVRLRERGAIAVDMESVWLAPGAGARPFAVVRVISDTPAPGADEPAADGGGGGPRDGRVAPRGGRACRVDPGGVKRVLGAPRRRFPPRDALR